MACIQGYGNPKSWLQTRHLLFPGNSLAWWLNCSPSWTRRFTLRFNEDSVFFMEILPQKKPSKDRPVSIVPGVEWFKSKVWEDNGFASSVELSQFLWQKKMQRWQKNIKVIRSLCSKVTLFAFTLIYLVVEIDEASWCIYWKECLEPPHSSFFRLWHHLCKNGWPPKPMGPNPGVQQTSRPGHVLLHQKCCSVICVAMMLEDGRFQSKLVHWTCPFLTFLVFCRRNPKPEFNSLQDWDMEAHWVSSPCFLNGSARISSWTS